MAYVFALVAGILNMLQSGANATLNKSLGAGPVVPALIVYAGGALGVLLASPFIGGPLGNVAANAHAVPWWAWIGGLLASSYVIATLTISQSLGAGTFTALTVTAAVVTSLLLDHFGWLGFAQHTASLGRLAGGALMIAGVALIALF